jgi:cytochrome bd-type quinol oxidase subunit 2
VEVLAVVLLAVPIIGYAVVGGAGLGLGMLLPWLGTDAAQRRAVRDVLRPLVRAGWGWLSVVVIAVLASAGLGEELSGGLAPVLAVVAAGEVARVVAFAGWVSEGAGNVLVTAGSWVTALGWGWVLGSLIIGGSAEPAGGMLVLVAVVAVALLILAHGLVVGARRLTGQPFQRARMLVGRGSGTTLLPLTAAVLAALPLAAGARVPVTDYAPRAALVVVLAVAGAFALAIWVARQKQRRQPGRGAR